MKNANQAGKKCIRLPPNFQENLTICEVKYESGDRSPLLIQDLFSLYLSGADYYRDKKNTSLMNFFKSKYTKLLIKPETSTILVPKSDTFSQMETHNSTNRTKDDNKTNSNGTNQEKKNTNNFNEKYVGIQNKQETFNKDKLMLNESNAFNTISQNERIKYDFEGRINKKSNGFKPDSQVFSSNLDSNRVSNFQKCSTSRKSNSKLDMSFNYENTNSNDIKTVKNELNSGKKNKFDWSSFKDTIDHQKQVKKEFIENQSTVLLDEFESEQENFEEIKNIEIEKQRFNFLERKELMKKAKQENPVKKEKKYIRRSIKQFNEVYNNLIKSKTSSQSEMVNEILKQIEKSLLISQESMHKEIEKVIENNINEMNIAIRELESNYEEEIEKFEEGGIAFSDVIQNLKEELAEQIEITRNKYEEERQNQIRKVKANFLKSV